MYEHGHVQQQKGGKKEEATSCRGRSELHSGSHQFLWLSGTLCYDLSWPIGRKSAQGTESPFHIAHHPMLLAAVSFTGRSRGDLIGHVTLSEMTTLQ